MGSVKEDIAELDISTTSTVLTYEGQGISLHLSKKDIKQILSLVCKRIEGAGLTDDELLDAVSEYIASDKDWLSGKRLIAQTQLQHYVDVIKGE